MSANTINRQITGTIAVTNGTVSLPTWGLPVVGLELSGTWVMNLDVKVVVGSTEVDAVVVTGAGAPVSLPLTANQTVFVDAAGAAEVIVRANPRTSGTVTVALNATSGKLPTAPGGSAVSISDGSDAALGAKADAAAGSDTGTFSLIALIKRLLQKFTVLNAFYGLTHNNAAPGATNLGVLAGVATAARPTYTEGDQVLLSTNLGGDMRVIAAGHTPAAPTCTFTRPANITAYTIGDEVGTNGTAPTTIPVARF